LSRKWPRCCCGLYVLPTTELSGALSVRWSDWLCERRIIVEFEEWMLELKRIAVEEYDFNKEEVFDREAWKNYFDEGFNPGEALIEDISYV